MKRTLLTLRARGKALALGRVTQIMGIINCTPDSFSGDGQFLKGKKVNTAACLRLARRMTAEGADILDVGGESTRPGARPVSVKEELKRVIPVVEAISRTVKAPVSVDTSKIEVARAALDAGASIINNIQSVRMNAAFLKTVRDYQAAIVLMHMRGTPATMQTYARYKDVVQEVFDELKISVEKCLQVGIKKDRIIVDPGIGFAKTMEQNLMLLKNLNPFKALGCPILLGTSRKSFIGRILDKPEQERLMGTAATVAVGVMQGAHIVRVHDVGPIKEILKVTDAILHAQS